MSAPQTRADSKTGIVEQVKTCLHSGDYSRALDLLRGKAAEFPDDVELLELEKLAQDGIKRKAEADRLITESQGLFAQQKSAEAIQLLRTAYELDKKNSLARSILANALVEYARSFVETDWLEAEKLTNQALSLNPAHPTAKTILSLIVEQKTTSSVEDWVSQARKLQSSGDIFGALAWVAEGLAVHPHDSKLLQIQDAIQRDQEARRRQDRRRDLDDLQRMEREIDGAADAAAKQSLAERIQAVAAKYWTDGEILSIANTLLLRLGLIPKGSSSTSPHSKGATVIFRVPRPSAPKPSSADPSQIPPGKVSPRPVPREDVSPVNTPPAAVLPTDLSAKVLPVDVPSRNVLHGKVLTTTSEPQVTPSPAGVILAPEPPSSEVKGTSLSSRPEQRKSSNLITLILVSAAVATVAVIATLFFAQKHYAPQVGQTPSAVPAVPEPTISATASPTPTVPARAIPAPVDSASTLTTPEQSLPTAPLSSNTTAAKVTPHIRKAEQPRLISNLQPQPRLASLTVQGGAPGATVFVDQILVGTVQPDGTLSVSTVNPGDHTVELRKERFKSRQFKEHFVAGGAISFAAADAALEALPGELKITFAPAEAKVAIVKGQQLTIVSSGVPLNLAAGTYTLTARTADGFSSSSTLEVIAGQSRTLDLSFAPSGMSNWDDPAAWKPEKDSFIRKGGNFVLYRVAPASGTFAFSVLPAKGRPLQWVFNYTDAKNYVLFRMDDDNFYRTVISNGEKTDEIKIPEKSDKKSFRALRIRVSATEIVHQIKQGDRWTVLDRLSQPGTNLSLGKFGFYLPGDDQIALSGFAHYADLNLR